MAKVCSEPGCNRSLFGGAFCAYHQFRRYMRGGDKYKPRPRKSKPIKRRTTERAKDERYYAVKAREFFDDAVKNKTNRCFFCDNWVTTFQGLHHIEGRDNNHLLDWDKVAIAHNKCHTDDYHYAKYEDLSAQPWYNDFMSRLKEKSEKAYQKELRKRDKSLKLNPEIFDEDENSYH